mgnify:CR=1 FL=1
MKNRRLLLSAAAIAASAGMAHAQSFAEGFESTAAGGYPATWVNNNQSVPGPGLVTWNVQNPGGVFPAHTGTAMLSVNYNSGTGLSTLSNWLILPQVTLTNGDTFSFWTQTNPAQVYPDRLQVRMSLAGASTNSGTSETDVGDFSNLLLDINPTYTTTGYPGTWTQYTATVSGLGAPTSGRIAFRYFVENGGPSGANSDYIGVDDVIYNSVNSVSGACCAPSGTCSLVSSVACATVGGVYRGDNTTCANANCPQPPVFTMTCGVQGTFTDISTTGTLITDGDDSVAPFVSSVTNALVTNPNLNACTNGFVSDSATYNAYTNSTLPVGGIGLGLWVNWDDLFADPGVGKVLHQAVVENGVNVEVIEWYNVRTFAGGAGSAPGHFESQIFGAGGPPPGQYP